MNHQLVIDFVENSRNKPYEKINYLEDFAETHPTEEGRVEVVYSLYEVIYSDNTKEKFISTMSRSANVVLPATYDTLKELFPHYIDEEQVNGQANAGTGPS